MRDLREILDRFETAASTMNPAYAARVRKHLRARIASEEGFNEWDLELEDLDAPAPTLDPRPYLVLHEGQADEHLVLLEQSVVIGRGHRADLQILGDPKLSRFHCKLEATEAGWVLVDLSSSNGSMVNGESQAPEQPRRLYGGEELILGETFVRFRFGDPG